MNHEMKRMMAFLLAGMLLLMGGCRASELRNKLTFYFSE